MNTTTQYRGIQALRFVAALLVVITHTMFYAQERTNNDFPVWAGGSVGVDIFFTISGFVMIISAPRFVKALGGWKYFGMARVTRIVPMYWIATTLKIAIMLIVPGAALHAALNPHTVVYSYLFLPVLNGDGAAEPILGVGWTLIFEMFFYLVFTLGLFFRVNVYIFSSAIMILFAAGHLVRHDWSVWGMYFDVIVLYFVIGMTIAKIAQSQHARRILWIVVGGLVVTAAVMAAIGDADWERNALFRKVIVSLILAAVVLAEPVLSKLPRWVMFLGAASYAMYLFHSIFAPAIPTILAKVGITNQPLSVGISIAAVVIMSALIYQYVEIPVTKLARRLPYAGKMPMGEKLAATSSVSA